MQYFNNPFNYNNANKNVNNNNISLQELQKKLEMAQQEYAYNNLNPNQKLGGSFGKLQDFIQNTNYDKVNFANNDETIIEKYNNMKDVFVLFMLENSRPQFEHWCKERNLNVIDDYVDSFIAKTNEYVEPLQKSNNEIEELKKEIELLKKQMTLRKDVI